MHLEGASPWAAIKHGAPVPGDTASCSSFSTAMDWLDNYRNNHTSCKSPENPFLPTRVLDLGSPGEDRIVRLYESRNMTAPYVCLSHCWGTAPCLTTETTTLLERKEGIPWDILPRTFREAVIFVRRLGVRYLWIDSLCILQNSREDWHREAAQMPSIYQNSILTIAASKSKNSSEGLFSPPPKGQRGCKLAVVTVEGKPYIIYARRALPHWYGLNAFEDLVHLPLLDRGWAYQERLLAPRYLHFGSREILWECKEETMCECHPERLQSASLRKVGYNRLLTSDVLLADKHAVWCYIVVEYSRLQLSHQSDRLAAISGLAKQMQPFRDGRYLAGLWEDTLLPSLCWDTLENGYGERSNVNAPTWS